MLRRALLIASLFLATACAHNATAARAATTFQFTPSAGNALVILYRNVAGFMGGGAAVNATITVDNKALGDLGQDRYAVIEVAPGEHTVNLMGMSGMSNVLTVVVAGDVRYVQVMTSPTLNTTQKESAAAMRDLDNEGEPLQLGFKYSFSGAAPGPAANTSRL